MSRALLFTVFTLLAVATMPVTHASNARNANVDPTVTITASIPKVILKEPCDPPYVLISTCQPTGPETLTVTTKDFPGKDLTFDYFVTGGSVSGEGSSAKWNLSGQLPGFYAAIVTVTDPQNHKATANASVEVEFCKCVEKK